MTQQLTLIDSSATAARWQLDDRTREVGRRGIAAARAAIRLARGRDIADDLDVVHPAA